MRTARHVYGDFSLPNPVAVRPDILLLAIDRTHHALVAFQFTIGGTFLPDGLFLTPEYDQTREVLPLPAQGLDSFESRSMPRGISHDFARAHPGVPGNRPAV
jgi:hypothetical protein